MPRPAPRHATIVAAALLLLAVVLVVIAATGWRGWAPAIFTVGAICVGPGIGWQNLRGGPRLNPSGIGIAAAISIGTVVVLGLVMNALTVPLTRGHWAGALAAVLAVLGSAAVASPSDAYGEPAQREAQARRPRRRAHALIAATCAALAVGGALIAWSSQRHWLARQHYTELYALRAGSAEHVTVSNHEGEPVSYTARIAVAGHPPRIVAFTLDNGETWTQTVSVPPALSTAGKPILDVELARVGVPGVYRFIRLLRPQPTALPAPG